MVVKRAMDLENKKIAINNDDTLCCARAIMTMNHTVTRTTIPTVGGNGRISERGMVADTPFSVPAPVSCTNSPTFQKDLAGWTNCADFRPCCLLSTNFWSCADDVLSVSSSRGPHLRTRFASS